MTTLLDYIATNTNAALACRKSEMTLKSHSDGSCPSVINDRSRVAGHFYFGDNDDGEPDRIEPNQGSMHQEFSVIKPAMASAAECETATLFINCQTAIVIRTTTMELGHE